MVVILWEEDRVIPGNDFCLVNRETRNKSSVSVHVNDKHIPYFRERILWVERTEVLLVVQVTVAIISLSETILVQYLSYKVILVIFIADIYSMM